MKNLLCGTLLVREGVAHRTDLMPLAEAEEMVKALAESEPGAQVKPFGLDATRGYVLLPVTDPEELTALLDAEQARRVQSALKEGDQYQWARDPDCAVWRVATCSGETYEVDLHARSCTCPDAERLRRVQVRDLLCKHRLALGLRRGTFADSMPTFAGAATRGTGR